MTAITEVKAGRGLDALVAEKVMGLEVASATAPAIYVEGDWSVYPATEIPDVGPESGWMCYSGLEPVFVRHCCCDIAEPELRIPSDWLIESCGSRAEAENTCAEWYADELAKHKADLARWGHSHHCLNVVPPYSTDIAAAWEVVEKLEDFALFAPGQPLEGGVFSDDEQWVVYCAMPMDELGWAMGETPALAICRAALKAVGA